MYPTLQIGPLTLPTYSTLYAIATFIGGMISFARLQALGRDPNRIARLVLTVIAAAFAGTYAIGIVPVVIASLQAGAWVPNFHASYVGTVGLSVPVARRLARRMDLPWGKTADLGGLHWPLFLAIGRIGCLGAGCCYGVQTDSPLGMYLRNVNGQWAIRYPTQMMSGTLNLAMFLLMLALERYGLRRARHEQLDQRIWPFDGFLFTLYIGLASLERFSLEFIRGDAQRLVGPLSWVHMATLASAIAAAVIIARHWPTRTAAGTAHRNGGG